MRNNIDVAFGEENHVSEAGEISKTGGAIFDNLENTIDAFADSVGEGTLDEGNDIGVVGLQGSDKSTQGWKAAFQSGGHPFFEESLGRCQVVVAPEMIELILEDPRAMNTTI